MSEKDFPDSVLEQIAHTPNVCKNIHMPAQSGSTSVLKKMRRGYSREVYDNLITRVRQKIPDITLSSDFISGFCSETEQDHQETLDLLSKVQYEQAFMFAYSMREKTHAQYKLTDDVTAEEKLRRLQEVISTFRKYMLAKNELEEGTFHLMLVEGRGRKSSTDKPTMTGRTDGNKRCVIAAGDMVLLPEYTGVDDVVEVLSRGGDALPTTSVTPSRRIIRPGDYVIVRVDDSKGQTLYGHGVGITSLVTFHHAHAAYLDQSKWLDIHQGVY